MTAMNSSSTNLAALMKDISEALQLDRCENNEEAYRKYLECVLRITTKLLRNLHSDGGHVNATPDLRKMVKLGQQCMDRVAIIINERYDNTAVKRATATDMRLPLSSGPGPSRTRSTGTPSTPSPVFPHPPGQITSPSSAVAQVSSQFIVQKGSTSEKIGKRQKKLTPMEVAKWQNEQLLSAFKARQTIAQKGKNRSFSVNLSLTLQRKMAENLAIAKAQQEILAKKMKERQQRLEEQAAKRFHTPMGLSEEEQHQRLIYRKVLEFEQEELWMIDQRKRLEENPTDVDVICQLITTILGCDTHPLTEQLKSYQAKMLKKVYHIVEGKFLRVERIKVPLPEDLYSNLKTLPKSTENLNTKTSLDEIKSRTDQSETGLQSIKEDQSESTLDDSHDITKQPLDTQEHADDANTDSEGQRLTHLDGSDDDDDIDGDKISNIQSKSDNIDKTTAEKLEEPGSNSDDDVMENVLNDVNENIKNDLQVAIKKGENLKEKLESENQLLKSLTRQSTTDYDKYNQENMDDLFDDDDDDKQNDGDVDDDKDGAAGNAEGTCSENTALENQTNENRELVESRSDSQENKSNLTKAYTKTLQKNPSFENLENKISELRNEAYHRHLKGITDDILTSIEKVQVLFVIAFAELDSAEGRDQCNVLLEGFFFRPLWNYLLVLFRLANEPKEIAIASVMTGNQSCSPADYLVRDELSLAPSSDNNGYPYQQAVTELLSIVNCPNMLEKLECLVRTSRLVMQCVEHHYKQTDVPTPSIGADDLLPVLCYIVARSGLPQIVSECHAMDRFIHEGYMFGEEGYCLTSFQTAINYLISQGMPPQI